MDNSELISWLRGPSSEDSGLRTQLLTKLKHLHERLQAVPVPILDQVRLFVEHRLHLFDDEAILGILHDVMRTSKYATKKAASESSEAFPLAVVAATVVHRLNKGSHVWPEKVLELYLDDALGARMWVDAPESRQFVTSLLSWTTAPVAGTTTTTTTITSTSTSTSSSSGGGGGSAFAKMEQDGDDDSSGDEEILEDSSPRFAGGGPSSSVSFASSHAPLLELTMRALNSRINPSAGTAIVSGTWTLLVTIGELLGLAEVRSLAAAHLERWLVNPVLFERVCGLLRHMAACLALVPEPRGDGTRTGTGSLCLLASDAAVVAEVVKMKGRIKASQADMYKNILLAMVQRHGSIAKMVLMLVIQEDLLAGAHTNMLSKIQETVKLLVSLLGHLADAPGKGITRKYHTSSYILGDAVGTLCVGNAGGVADIFPTSGVGSAGQSPLFKVLVDLLVRLHRSLGISDMDQCACLRGFLAALAARGPHASSLAMQPVLCGFVAELCVCMQLVCAHEAMVSDKESSSAGGGRGAGPVAAGGRGGRGGPGVGPKGGRMSEKTSAIFLTAASSSSSKDRDRLAAVAAAAAASSSTSAVAPSGANKVSREALMTSCLHAQEIALQWMRDLVSGTPPAPRTSNSNFGGGLPECHPSHDKSADWWINWTYRVLLLPSPSSLATQSHVHNKVDVDKASVLLLRDFGYISDLVLTLVCECIYQVSRNTGHISLALSILEALVHRACRTHCPGASNRSSTGEGKGWTDRGGLPGFAVLVERPESIGCLFGLCVVRPSGSKKLLQQCALPLSLVAAPSSQAADGEATAGIPEGATLVHMRRTDRPFDLPLPMLASRALYWRVCVVCYQLGCARPDTLGRYLWDNIPTVQTLLVMSISSRFFHPPSSMYLDARASAASASASASSADMEVDKAEPASALAYHQEGSAFVVVVTPQHVEVRPYAAEDFNGGDKPPIVSSVTGEGEGAVATVTPQPIGGRINLLQAEEALQVLENELWRYFFAPAPREGPRSSEYDGADKKRRMTRALEEYAALERERQINAEKKAKESQARAERAAKRHGIATLDPAPSLPPPPVVPDIVTLAALDFDGPPHKKPCCEEEATFEFDGATVTLPPRFVSYSIPILTPSSYPPRATLFETPGLGDLLFINSPVPRQAPPETIKMLRTIDAKFNFGASLRASIDPDFIVRTIYHSSSTDAQGRPEVIRETIERNSSWLISAIAVNVEVVLSRIPGTACVHLLLLTVHKVYSRLEEIGVWRDSTAGAAAWRGSILFSPRDAILAELMEEEETQSHVALLVQFIRKLLLCSEADKRDIFAAILADLHAGYHRGRVGRMTLAMCSNAGQAASAISSSKIEQVLRAGPVHCEYLSFFSSVVGAPGFMQALQQHVQNEDLTVVQGCVGKLLQMPGAEDTAVQISAHILTHRPDLVRALSLSLDCGGGHQQGVWQAMRVYLGNADAAGTTSLASIAHASALLTSIVFDWSAGVRSAAQDRFLALLHKEAPFRLLVSTFCLFAASPVPAQCAALVNALEASVAQPPPEACVMIIFAMLQQQDEVMPCSTIFLDACLRVIGSIDSSSAVVDWGGLLGKVLSSQGKEAQEKERCRVVGMAQEFFSPVCNIAGNCAFLLWLFAQQSLRPSTPLCADIRTVAAALAPAGIPTNELHLCAPLQSLSLHETMQELVRLHRRLDQDSSAFVATNLRLLLLMLLEGAGDVQGCVDSVSRQCLANLTALASWVVPLLTGDPDQAETVGMLARLLHRPPEIAAVQEHRALALAVAQYAWERLVLLSVASESPGGGGVVCACRWLVYSCYLPYPAETLAMVHASLGDDTSYNKSATTSSSSSSKKGVTPLDSEALFHLLMLAEGESRENGFLQASQADLAVATRGMDYLDLTADEGGAAAASCALDRPLAFALHVLSARLPVPATLDAGTQIQALEEFDDETVRAASLVLRTAAERHPALFLRCIAGIYREIQCSLKLANYASVSAGQRHKVFKPPAPASHPLWATFLGGGGGGGGGGGKVQVVFRSRRCVEINECLWGGVRNALLALPGYMCASSAGCRGERSIHDLLRVLTDVFDQRQHLSFLPSLSSSTLRDFGGAAEANPSAELAFLDSIELRLHQGGQQLEGVSWGHLLSPNPNLY